jgi:hypothetical protein
MTARRFRSSWRFSRNELSGEPGAVHTVHILDKPLNELPGCDEWLKKLVIPAQRVSDLAVELDVLGVRLADLFPDLQNLAKAITNMHRPSRA